MKLCNLSWFKGDSWGSHSKALRSVCSLLVSLLSGLNALFPFAEMQM